MADETDDIPEEKKLPKDRKAPWLKKYQFQKGQSGNPSGKPKGTLSLRKRLESALREDEGAKAKEVIERLIELATTGGDNTALRAIAQIMDRIDGTPVKQHVVHTPDSVKKFVHLYDDDDDDDETGDDS